MDYGVGMTELVVAAGKVLFGSGSTLHVLDAANSPTTWTNSFAANANTGSPIIADGKIFVTVSNYDSGLHCFGDPFLPVTNN